MLSKIIPSLEARNNDHIILFQKDYIDMKGRD